MLRTHPAIERPRHRVRDRRQGEHASDEREDPACGNSNTVRWLAFDTEPVPGDAPTACSIPPAMTLASHICNLASSRALARGADLEARSITTDTIGLGSANPEFLNALATGPGQVFFAPDSDQLRGIFQKIAREIKLRMVQ